MIIPKEILVLVFTHWESDFIYLETLYLTDGKYDLKVITSLKKEGVRVGPAAVKSLMSYFDTYRLHQKYFTPAVAIDIWVNDQVRTTKTKLFKSLCNKICEESGIKLLNFNLIFYCGKTLREKLL